MSERVDVQQLRETVLRGMGPTINASGGSSNELQWQRHKALNALDALLARLDVLEEVAEAAEAYTDAIAKVTGVDDELETWTALIQALVRLREGNDAN